LTNFASETENFHSSTTICLKSALSNGSLYGGAKLKIQFQMDIENPKLLTFCRYPSLSLSRPLCWNNSRTITEPLSIVFISNITNSEIFILIKLQFVPSFSFPTAPDSFEGREKMREKWLVQVFDQADSTQTGTLDESETISLMKRLNSPLCIESLRQKIAEFELEKKNSMTASLCSASASVNSSKLDAQAASLAATSGISKNAFISLFNQTATRPDIYFILVR